MSSLVAQHHHQQLTLAARMGCSKSSAASFLLKQQASRSCVGGNNSRSSRSFRHRRRISSSSSSSSSTSTQQHHHHLLKNTSSSNKNNRSHLLNRFKIQHQQLLYQCKSDFISFRSWINNNQKIAIPFAIVLGGMYLLYKNILIVPTGSVAISTIIWRDDDNNNKKEKEIIKSFTPGLHFAGLVDGGSWLSSSCFSSSYSTTKLQYYSTEQQLNHLTTRVMDSKNFKVFVTVTVQYHLEDPKAFVEYLRRRQRKKQKKQQQQQPFIGSTFSTNVRNFLKDPQDFWYQIQDGPSQVQILVDQQTRDVIADVLSKEIAINIHFGMEGRSVLELSHTLTQQLQEQIQQEIRSQPQANRNNSDNNSGTDNNNNSTNLEVPPQQKEQVVIRIHRVTVEEIEFPHWVDDHMEEHNRKSWGMEKLIQKRKEKRIQLQKDAKEKLKQYIEQEINNNNSKK